jgi:hypothetical protein
MKRTIIHSNGLFMKGKTQTIVTSEEMEKKRGISYQQTKKLLEITLIICI